MGNFVVAWMPFPFNRLFEFILGMMYETEDRMGLIADDRYVEGETGGFVFDNSKSLDELEEHEKIDGHYVHPEFDPNYHRPQPPKKVPRKMPKFHLDDLLPTGVDTTPKTDKTTVPVSAPVADAALVPEGLAQKKAASQ